jgi:hypothetical protein
MQKLPHFGQQEKEHPVITAKNLFWVLMFVERASIR